MQNNLENIQNDTSPTINYKYNHNVSSNNFIRSYDYRNDTFCIANKNKDCCVEKHTNDLFSTVNIFRYKFELNFTNEMCQFSKIHQYDHRKDFKEAWEIWLEENADLVCDEIRHLKNLGYNGDILDKMFKSARYYFRKKSTEKKAPQTRREYQSVQKQLLEAMDNHIKSHINVEDYKPSEGFDIFCKKNIDLLKEEVNILCKNGFTNSEEIKNKIKKTYKNRYFILISKEK